MSVTGRGVTRKQPGVLLMGGNERVTAVGDSDGSPCDRNLVMMQC